MTPRRLLEPGRLAGPALLASQSDERLVDMHRAGHGPAFEAIVRRYRRPLQRYCERILPPARAEDAVQQAFLNAHTALRDGAPPERLRPWLYRVAHNAALNLLRQNGWTHEPLDPSLDGVERPDQAFERREGLRATLAALQALPERQRDALVLRELEGRSYDEIAAALGVSGGAVRQLLHRARATLQAGVSAVTPFGLLVRLPGAAAGEASAARVAELAAGAGGGALLAKVAATAAATVAVVAAVPADGPDRSRPVASAAAAERADPPARIAAARPAPALPRKRERARTRRSARAAPRFIAEVDPAPVREQERSTEPVRERAPAPREKAEPQDELIVEERGPEPEIVKSEPEPDPVKVEPDPVKPPPEPDPVKVEPEPDPKPTEPAGAEPQTP